MGKQRKRGQSRTTGHFHHKPGEGTHSHHHLHEGAWYLSHHKQNGSNSLEHQDGQVHSRSTSTTMSTTQIEASTSTEVQDPLCLPLDDSFEHNNSENIPSIKTILETPTKSEDRPATELINVPSLDFTPTREEDRSPTLFANDITPIRQNRHGVRGSRINNHSFRKKRGSQLSLRSVVQQVSRNAAISTKKAVWDSNQISVDAAIRAVDQWEALYNLLRNFTGMVLGQAHNVYQASKSGALQMEQGILRPVRDWIVMPAFGGIEQLVLFLQSEQARHAAETSLGLVGMIPLVGENMLCPALCITGGVIQQSWEIVKYPIPSRQQVRESVGWALDSFKWALHTTFREIFLYLKRADANITRTLSHTQWKVLGSGPYATLDEETKQEVLSHIIERYCSLHPLYDGRAGRLNNGRMDHDCVLARYELAAHIKRHNPSLYEDLIRSGLLQNRGGPLFQDDEWLTVCPVYRHIERNNFLIPECLDATARENVDGCTMKPLWFRLPCVNGKPPANKDAPWVCFTETEQHELEIKYREMVLMPSKYDTSKADDPDQKQEKNEDDIEIVFVHEREENDDRHDKKVNCSDSQHSQYHQYSQHPTVAQWYTPDPSRDVMVDQCRHAVSLWFYCKRCKTPLGCLQGQRGDFICSACRANRQVGHVDAPFVPFTHPPPVSGLMRPTFWRFHGNGDIVRRSNWFLDTPRNGLQPFDEGAQAVLEDAYLFLKWIWLKKQPRETHVNKDLTEKEEDDTLEGALLTVEVTCPDGAVRLIQFASLTQATAIQKGLSAAVSINKLRVFRGAWLPKRRSEEEQVQLPPQPVELSIQESIHKAASEHGTLGQTMVPNVCLRDILTPPPQPKKPVDRASLHSSNRSPSFLGAEDLAVPTFRLFDERMAKHFIDPKGGNIDHLCLIVHGIGEMMQTIDLFGLALPNLSTIVDCCGYLRRNHSEVQMTDFSEIYSTGAANQDVSSVGRVEYLPIEWHEAFSILSQRRSSSPLDKNEGSVMLKDLCLPTIPNMREFANDTLMDVLYFMSPEHHDVIVDIVTHEMNEVVERFRAYTGFSGKISIIGHSLGSVVTWDILNNQQVASDDKFFQPTVANEEEVDDLRHGSVRSLEGGSAASDYGTARSDFGTSRSEEANDHEPEVNLPPPSAVSFKPSYLYPQLDFKVDNFFLLGSPVPVFLMIRNQRKPMKESFYLKGCRRVFNIFHPYDPVSYRIEPCIDPRNADFEPTIIKHWNGGFRVQYQTKRLWRQILDTTWETQQQMIEAFEAHMAGMGLLDTMGETAVEEGAMVRDDDNNSECTNNVVITGRLNGGRRIDYMLQEKEIENANEYVAALAAHSCYWTEKDLSLFIARQIFISKMEQETDFEWDLQTPK